MSHSNCSSRQVSLTVLNDWPHWGINTVPVDIFALVWTFGVFGGEHSWASNTMGVGQSDIEKNH